MDLIDSSLYLNVSLKYLSSVSKRAGRKYATNNSRNLKRLKLIEHPKNENTYEDFLAAAPCILLDYTCTWNRRGGGKVRRTSTGTE